MFAATGRNPGLAKQRRSVRVNLIPIQKSSVPNHHVNKLTSSMMKTVVKNMTAQHRVAWGAFPTGPVTAAYKRMVDAGEVR